MRHTLPAAAVASTMLAFAAGYAHATAYTFAAVDVPGANETYATGINDAGQIVSIHRDESGVHGFVATPAAVPEPAGMAPFGLGLVCAGLARRKRA